MYIDLLKEKDKIEALGEIKSVGLKVIEDDIAEYTRLILEDVDGKTYEFPLCHSNMEKQEDYWIRYTKAVIVNIALEKSFGADWFKMAGVQVVSEDIPSIITAINNARKIKPFEQSGCINEEKLKIYDHICPVFIL